MSFDTIVNVAAIRFLIVIVTSVGLAACGFRLAGSANLPQNISSIHLLTSGFDAQQHDALRVQLRRAGAELVNQDDLNAVMLMASFKALPNRRLVSSARDGKTVERLTLSLEFSLKSASGEILVPTKTLVHQKNIVLDDDNLLASGREKANVVKDLEQALFEQLIRQLNRI